MNLVASGQNYTIHNKKGYWQASFRAMGSPCDIFVDVKKLEDARRAAEIGYQEAIRIEKKYSRYRKDNIVHQINTSNGMQIEVDQETGLLLDYAQLCYQLSDGMFDITSGVLREAWTFDGSDHIPATSQVEMILSRVGWQRLTWKKPFLCLKPGMEIDLGGIGKEYAVDRTAALLRQAGFDRALVNFGGDLVAIGPMRGGNAWVVEIEVATTDRSPSAISRLHIKEGALATSGDTHRFLIRDGIRYSHILNPKTGWPVPGVPRTVTVLAENCLDAGMLSSFAMLQAEEAEKYLEEQGVKYWCQR